LPNFGVFKTSDGGATWQSASQGLGSAKVISLAIDASNADILYAGTLAQGVYKSLDGGGTWRWSSGGMDPNEPIFTIAIDPVHTNVVYAGSLRSGVFRSENGGQGWVKINTGLRTRSVHDLAISADGGTLYAGTRGEGVFRLDLNGQPPAPAPTPTSIPTSIPTTITAPTVVPPPGAASPTPTSAAKPGICGGALILPLVMFGLWLFRRRY
jgi:photosystem II stability/assembly factor-like uncharacterized protein